MIKNQKAKWVLKFDSLWRVHVLTHSNRESSSKTTSPQITLFKQPKNLELMFQKSRQKVSSETKYCWTKLYTWMYVPSCIILRKISPQPSPQALKDPRDRSLQPPPVPHEMVITKTGSFPVKSHHEKWWLPHEKSAWKVRGDGPLWWHVGVALRKRAKYVFTQNEPEKSVFEIWVWFSGSDFWIRYSGLG